MTNLYLRLAKTNMKNSKQFYLPYILTGILTVAMFYIMIYLAGNKGLSKVPGSTSLAIILMLGCIVIAIFAFIFLFYTNSFIIRRRKKEIGMYNILGMEKRHIAKVISLETIFTALLSVVGGLIFGMVFSKLLSMLLYKIIGVSESIEFYVSVPGIQASFILFGFIYAATLCYNLLQIRHAKPIELLHGENVGEREPKTKILMTLVGAICLAAGYYISITTENPLSALLLFFVAVILVIIGTYCLFTAGSIALLKLLRKNKKFYYKSKHFTAVSGMMYRMKQNAVGLANICILSTMVLVMVSTTVSLFFGVEDSLNTRFPSEISANIHYKESIGESTDLINIIKDKIKENGRTITDEYAYANFSLTTMMGADGSFEVEQNSFNYTDSDTAVLTFMTRDEFLEMNQSEEAKDVIKEIPTGNVAVVGYPSYTEKKLSVLGHTYQVAETYEFTSQEDEYMSEMVKGFYYVIVDSDEMLQQLYMEQRELLGNQASDYIEWVFFQTDGTADEKLACANNLEKLNAEHYDGPWNYFYLECRQSYAEEFYAMYGGLFFLGMFLGTMFLMVTVLIIFYKQISEGYDDKMRFQIMEKVGMSNTEVKASIRSQVRIVFFLPLITAAIHVTFAFPIIRRILAVLNMSNVELFRNCLIGTIIIFAVIYYIVFKLTSRTYYKIVGNQIQ